MLLLRLSHFSCVRLCNPIVGSPPGSPVPGILQARTLEWVAIAFSKACMHAKLLQSCQTLCEAPLSTGSSRQEYWSGLPFPSPILHMMLLMIIICLPPLLKPPFPTSHLVLLDNPAQYLLTSFFHRVIYFTVSTLISFAV